MPLLSREELRCACAHSSRLWALRTPRMVYPTCRRPGTIEACVNRSTLQETISVRKLLLVKHAVPDIIPTLPSHAWHLSTDGQQRCLPLARLLAPYCPATIVSSQEPKA